MRPWTGEKMIATKEYREETVEDFKSNKKIKRLYQKFVSSYTGRVAWLPVNRTTKRK